MNKTKTFFALCGFVFLFFACTNQEDVVVRVYDKELTIGQLQKMLPVFDSQSDSVEIRNDVIDNWIEEQVLLHEAQEALSSSEQNFDQEVEQYRNSLLIHAYLKKMVEKSVNREQITQAEIERYYKENREKYLLKQAIIKVNYLKLSPDSKQVEKTKELFFKTRTQQEENRFEQIVLNQALNFYMDDNWLRFDDVLKEIPIKNYALESRDKNRQLDLRDSTGIYLINIIDYKINEGYSPLSLVREEIVNILLQEKRAAIVHQLKKEAVEKAEDISEILY